MSEKEKTSFKDYVTLTYQIVGIMSAAGGLFFLLHQAGVFNGLLKQTVTNQEKTNEKLDTLIDVTADRKAAYDTLVNEVNRDENVSEETKKKVENLANEERALDRKVAALVNERLRTSEGAKGIVNEPAKVEAKPVVQKEEKSETVSDGFSDNADEGFASSASTKKKDEVRRNAARKTVEVHDAYLWGEQEILDNGTVKLRLSENSMIGGVEHPKNTVISGIAEKKSGRYFIHISQIKGTPVDLSVFEADSKAEGLTYRAKYPDSYKVLIGLVN